MPSDCDFCSRQENRGRIVLQNNLAWAFLTHTPIVPGHTLICPIRHVHIFDQLKPAEVKAIFMLLAELKVAMKKALKAEGFNFAWNEEEVAGQTVPHLHLHVVPRRKGDAGITECEPRRFLYRPGSREKSPEDELQATARLIRAQL